MRIDGSIPFQVARAYGVARLGQTIAPAPVQPVAAPSSTAREQSATPQRIAQLVAARVSGGVDFNTASTPAVPAGPFQLYTRAADRVEAALAVKVGRAVDITG